LWLDQLVNKNQNGRYFNFLFRYESRDALNGGKDGLDVVRQILYLAPQILSVGGQIWLEVYLDEPEMIKELVKGNKSIIYLTTLKDFTKR
ncbi:hypothetical protein AM593_05742, partial [Mytilus galloprovincialis]